MVAKMMEAANEIGNLRAERDQLAEDKHELIKALEYIRTLTTLRDDVTYEIRETIRTTIDKIKAREVE